MKWHFISKYRFLVWDKTFNSLFLYHLGKDGRWRVAIFGCFDAKTFFVLKSIFSKKNKNGIYSKQMSVFIYYILDHDCPVLNSEEFHTNNNYANSLRRSTG